MAGANERASGKKAGKESRNGEGGDKRREGQEQKLGLARVVFKLLPGCGGIFNPNTPKAEAGRSL